MRHFHTPTTPEITVDFLVAVLTVAWMLFHGPTPAHAQQMFQQSPALNYWVDSVNGSDSNPPGLPYATIAHLASIDAVLGRSVWNLRYDGHWLEELDLPRAYMTVQAYGTGTNLPLVDARSVIASGTWTQPRGAGTCYQITATIAVQGASPYVRMWENGAYLRRSASLADCDATAARYWVNSDAGPSITLYVHPSGSSDPGTNGSAYLYTKRDHAIESNFRATVRRIWAYAGISGNGPIITGQDSYLYNSRSSGGHKHNIYVSPGTTIDGLILDDIYWGASGPNPLVVYGDWTPGEVTTISNVHWVAPNVGSINPSNAAYSHYGTVPPDANSPIIYNNPIVDVGYYSGLNAGTASLVFNGGAIPCVQDCVGLTTGSVTVNGTTLTASGARIYGPGPGTLTITNATLTGVAGGTCIQTPYNSQTTVTGTTFNSCSMSFEIYGANPHLTSTGNIFVTPGLFNFWGSANWAAITLSSDYNSYPNGVYVASPVVVHSLTALQALGQDAHSTQ